MRSIANPPRRRINPKWKTWRQACRSLRVLIRKLKTEPSPHGQKWKDRTSRHYEARLEELLTTEPTKYLES